MKKILIYTNNEENFFQSDDKAFCQVIDEQSFKNGGDRSADFVFIDFDEDLPLKKIIRQHTSPNTLMFGFSTNTTKDNVKKAYELGLKHFIQRPKSFSSIIKNFSNNKANPIAANIMTKRVLIVDDSPSTIDLLEETLKNFDFEITSHTSPTIALKAITEEKFDLIILDIMMPELSGFDLAKKVQTSMINKNTPFIFISADSEAQSKIKGYNIGSYAYIEKPFDANTLRAQIANILKIKALQDDLFEKNRTLENIMKFSNNQLIQTDEHFNVTSSNSKYLNVKLNSNLLEYVKQRGIDIHSQELKEFMKSNEPLLKIDISIKHTDENRHYRVVISKIYNKDNLLTGFLIMVRDTTEEFALEHQKETFIATLTHDLKTPIRAELQVLDLLLNDHYGKLNDQQTEVMGEILNSNLFMQKMLDNLLFRYKHESKNFKIRKEMGNYKLLIEKCITTLKYIIQTKNQNLKVEYLAKQEDAMFDKTELSRVINNLISNASQFSPENSEIKITVKDDGKNIITTVKDKGIGISKEDLSFVFDKYAPAHKKFRRVGSGLGLYISKAIVEAHGGDINVISKIDKGSTFEFNFPILDKTLQPETTQSL